MKEIQIRQNEPDILELQFLQRKMYDSSKIYWRYSWYIAWLLIVLTMAFHFINLESSAAAIVIMAVLDILVFGLECLSDKKQKIGAAAKYYIDNILFEFSKPESKFTISKIRELAIECKEKNKKEYEIQIRNTGKDDPPGLKNWYTLIGSGDQNRIIFSCQKENAWWQSKLSKIYLNSLIIISGLLLILSLLVLCIFDVSVETITLFLLTNLGFVGKATKDINAIYRYNTIQIKIHENIEMIEKINEIDISMVHQLQDNINSLRKIKFLIPNFLHKKNSGKFHDLYSSVENNAVN